jgi:hypothetical protein
MIFAKFPQTEITKHWTTLKKHLEENLPPTALGLPINLDEVYTRLMTDEMQGWVFLQGEDAIGFLITAFSQELGFNFKNLTIYAVVATQHIDDEAWKNAFSTVKAFSIKYECKRIIAFSSNPRVIELVNKLGGESSYHVLTLEV